MGLSFIFPAALLLLLLLPGLWALAWLLPRRLAPWRFWGSLALRSGLAAALVLALAGAQLILGSRDLTTVFLIDSSDSITASARGQAEAFVQDALRRMPAQDRAALVVFGENALVERTPSEERLLGRITVVPQTGRTDIAQAIQLGLGLLPADSRKRLVLLSDGGENNGQAIEAARLAAARGVPIDVVDLGRPNTSEGEALVERLSAPTVVRQGQQFDLAVQIESTVAQTASLQLLADGQPLGTFALDLAAGVTRRTVRVEAQGKGFRYYQAVLVPSADGRAQNNRAETVVRVSGPARVLLVEGQPGEAENLRSALAAGGVDAETVSPQNAPADLVALSDYDALLLVNVAARDLPVKTMASLPSYVRELGRGLVMIGGDRSFGVGGYGRTPVEEILPVYTDVRNREERPDLALLFVIDKSGSMDACHCTGTEGGSARFQRGGTPKVDIAKEAVVQSAAVLRERDTVGVVAFDSQSHWVLGPRRGPSSEEVQRAVSPLLPEGGTNVRAGLEAALDALSQSPARIRHVILLTDGWSSGGDNLDVAERMRAQNITLSVVAAGSGSSEALRFLAQTGGGRYYPAEAMEQVPQIFVQETIAAVGNYIVEQPFTPRYAQPSPVLDGLADGLPQLYGYNGTTLKESASLVLAGLDDAPVLAQWQYGLGRSIAWTSDVRGKWGRELVRWGGFSRFVTQLVGWVLPSVEGGGLDAEIYSQGGQTVFAVRSAGPDGRPRDGLALRATLFGPGGSSEQIALEQVGPGRYYASVPSPAQGTYVVQIVGSQGERAVAQSTVGMVVPYSAEYRLGQSNPALLEQIAHTSGGTRLTEPEAAFQSALPPVRRAQEIGLPLLLLALLLLPLDIAVRRWR